MQNEPKMTNNKFVGLITASNDRSNETQWLIKFYKGFKTFFFIKTGQQKSQSNEKEQQKRLRKKKTLVRVSSCSIISIVSRLAAGMQNDFFLDSRVLRQCWQGIFVIHVQLLLKAGNVLTNNNLSLIHLPGS